MFTIIGAILGFVVGGGLATLAFNGGMDLAHVDTESQGWVQLFFSVPVFLLGSFIGLTIGTLVGARIDRRRGKPSIVRSVFGRAFTVIAALFGIAAIPAFLGAVYSGAWAFLAVVAVGVALCFVAWWVNREIS